MNHFAYIIVFSYSNPPISPIHFYREKVELEEIICLAQHHMFTKW